MKTNAMTTLTLEYGHPTVEPFYQPDYNILYISKYPMQVTMMVDIFKLEVMTGVTSYYISTPNTVKMDRFMILVNMLIKLEVVDYL